ncbi:hypothetical protein ACRHK7_01505 [Weissella tructae]|uniref:Uncharacterized protein n=3 Tax=Weissella TaxID=46255 RepID=A0A075U6V2_9LACO|nr:MULTISPECIES: hypothetical protein [Weissella]AIM63226.1 hypothetical protein WS74_0974 [Weissella ceti]AIG65847.1 hypothetical protein WS08_0908 [Weissella tructae]AIM64561.1 hypothetical protein WS105_0971 [Weissella ceti]ELA07218.1 hypothetical protein WCNC_02137 [Weissella ceti NC36]QVV91006.1 hypothetical protein KHQ32_05110 [Weissella tructae]
MQLTGNALIEALENEAVTTKTFTAADEATINLDDFFAFIQTTLEADQLVSAEMIISGDEPIKLSVETNLINLPIRYANAVKKIVINNEEADVNLYMIVEHPAVSQSGLRIDYAASVTAALDDFDSVAARIAAYFDEKIVLINTTEVAEEDDTTDSEGEA